MSALVGQVGEVKMKGEIIRADGTREPYEMTGFVNKDDLDKFLQEAADGKEKD